MVKTSLAAITSSSFLGSDTTHLEQKGSLILLGRIIQAYPCWMGSVGAQPISGLSRSALLSSGPDSDWPNQQYFPMMLPGFRMILGYWVFRM